MKHVIMKRNIARIIVLIFLLLGGYRAITHAYGVQREGLLSAYDYLPFISVIFLTILSLCLEWGRFRKHKRSGQLLISLIGMVLVIFVTFRYWQFHHIKSRQSILVLSSQAQASPVLRYDFKKGESFVLTVYDILGRDQYTGKYAQTGDSIRILGANHSHSLRLPEQGMLARDTMWWDGFEPMIVEHREP